MRRSHSASDPMSDALHAELLQERAANLGRLGARLERALAALREWDEAADHRGAPVQADPPSRDALLLDAGEALFLYVVQREASGLRGTATALDELGVPREVRLHMAPRSVLLARRRAG